MEKSIYQDLYEFETEQRLHLATTVNVSIVVTTAIGGAAVTMAFSYPYDSSPQANYFVGFVSFTALSLGIAIYCVFRSLIGYEYERLPSASNLRAFHAKLLKFNLETLGADKQSEAIARTQTAFSEGLEQRYSEAADVNRANNHNRGRFTYSANVTLALGAVMLAIASGFYLYSRITMPAEIHHVKIVGVVKMSATTTEQPPVQAPTRPVTPNTPGPVVIPTFPPNEKFRDHTKTIPPTVVTPKK
jgi:hypothetical protein